MKPYRSLCLACLALSVCCCGPSDRIAEPPADRIAPEVRLLFPFPADPPPTIVRDSTEVYVAARDSTPGGSPGLVAGVELYYRSLGSVEPIRIRGAMTPTAVEEIPDTNLRARLDLPSGWSLYTTLWYTGPYPLPPAGTPINSGTFVRLFAVARDPAGNRGQTPDSLLVRVVNSGDSGPYTMLNFVVMPPSGRVGDQFAFDPSITTDRLDTDAEIHVRWDFDRDAGDGWDVDWEADARANQVVLHSYASPGTYLVCLEGHTSYLPDSTVRRTRELQVSP